MTDLFTPLQLGQLTLQNRIFLAPLTRCRASEGHIPNKLMADYYGASPASMTLRRSRAGSS